MGRRRIQQVRAAQHVLRQRRGGCKDLEEEVNRRQDATAEREKERSGLLEPMERKQNLSIGAPKESKEALFRDMMLLDDVISKMVKELREAGRSLVARYAGMEKDRCQRAEGYECCWRCRP